MQQLVWHGQLRIIQIYIIHVSLLGDPVTIDHQMHRHGKFILLDYYYLLYHTSYLLKQRQTTGHTGLVFKLLISIAKLFTSHF